MLVKSESGEYLLQAFVDNAWTNQYAFDLHPWQWIDFAPANYMNSTHPDSIFVQKRLVIIHNLSGRVTLLGNSLKTMRNGIATMVEVDEDRVSTVLEDCFNLILS
jgi:N-hydroxyarylamine O-acetyltransferase